MMSVLLTFLSPSSRLIPTCQISWGTKQDSIVETDLGAVIQDSHSQVDVEVLAEAAHVNSMYEEALLNLKHRKAVTPKPLPAVINHVEQEQIAKDYYANVRTNVSSYSFTLWGWFG
jgi:chitin synthase